MSLDVGVRSKAIFKDWCDTSVMKLDLNICSEGLLLYPGTLAEPNYRNQCFKPPGIPEVVSVSSISIFAEVPDMDLPGMVFRSFEKKGANED